MKSFFAVKCVFLMLCRMTCGFRGFPQVLKVDRATPRLFSSMLDDISLRLSGKKVLVVQNKGGGHGSLAYYLVQTLIKSNEQLQLASKSPTQFTIWQEKCNYQKSPFKETAELQSKYGGVFAIDNNALTIEGTSKAAQAPSYYDYVVDNWSKSAQNVSYIFETLKQINALPSQYVFISSAGMYQQEELFPLSEEAKVKDSNDVRKTELALINLLQQPDYSSIKYTFLRPQYLYGPKSSKNYLSYFIGRVLRDRPIPIPLSGDQLVCLTHQQDAANLILAAIGNVEAHNQIFNLGSNRYISYKGIVELIYKSLKTPDSSRKGIIRYDPLDYASWKSSNINALFPFRRDTFITSIGKGIQHLKWNPLHSIEHEIINVIQEYMDSEDSKKQWGDDELKFDDELLAHQHKK